MQPPQFHFLNFPTEFNPPISIKGIHSTSGENTFDDSVCILSWNSVIKERPSDLRKTTSVPFYYMQNFSLSDGNRLFAQPFPVENPTNLTDGTETTKLHFLRVPFLPVNFAFLHNLNTSFTS